MQKNKLCIIEPIALNDYNAGFFEVLNSLKKVKTPTVTEFQRMLTQLSANPNHYIFVMKCGKQNIGAVTVLLEPKFIYGGRCLAHIEDFVILNTYQRQGYGQQLMHFILEFCNDKQCAKIALCSRTSAEQFYLKNKFSQIGKYFAFYIE
jgi:GNAT superfamily N-acetyltransferase